MSNPGLFGKLPCYGDFLCRDLDTSFVEVWDTWLQGYVSGTQEQLGESWLDTYLTSPIWRFAFSSGVVDENTWAGLLLPSVDRVGRYFPFSIVKKIGVSSPPVVMSTANSWFDELENIALQALEGETSVDDILELVSEVPFQQDEVYGQSTSTEPSMGTVINMEFESQNVQSVYPYFLHQLLAQQQSYSIWSTRGSQLVEPCVFYCKALPQISGAAAMLDGNWEASSWAQPFPIVASAAVDETQAQGGEVDE